MSRLAKILIMAFVIGIFAYTYATYFNQKEAEYEFVGNYEYVIKNDSLFNSTCLSSDSYGFAIGDLTIQGMEIKGIEGLDKTADYILSINYPVKAAFINSKAIEGEAMEHTSKRPLDIIQDKEKPESKAFLYKLHPKGKYRILLP